MRPLLQVLSVALGLLAASPVLAAPTCVDSAGSTIKCGEPDALPVGAAPSRPAPPDEAPVPAQPGFGLWAPLSLVAAIFALIALMPEFDGSRAEDWAPGESDD